MSAVETLQTAIDTLTRLRAKTTPAPWRTDVVSWYVDHSDVTLVGSGKGWTPLLDAGDFAASRESFVNAEDAELIVRLRNSVDPLLAFLRAARSDLTTERIRETDAAHAIALATAINGGAK